MTMMFAKALLLAAGTAMLAACTVQQGPTPAGNAAYAPYSEEGNPFCGALGTCESLSNVPHPLRGSSGW